jgi:uncharacterized protein YcaQ
MPCVQISRAQARRIALAAQGFDRKRPKSAGDIRHIRRTINQIGLLQLDYVNVLIPAHYLILYSRLGAYPRQRLHELVYRRREFIEQWAHEASIVPADAWPLLRHRRDEFRPSACRCLATAAAPAGRVSALSQQPDHETSRPTRVSEAGTGNRQSEWPCYSE